MTESPAVIAGRVVDASDNPVSGARVYFVDAPVPLPDVAALTDSRGRFSLGVPVPGTYRFQVAHEGFQQATCAVDVTGEGSIELEVRLES